MDTLLFLTTGVFISIAIAISGILSGLFGIGGGIVYVPLANWILGIYFPDLDNPMLIANNTSLASIVGLNLVTIWLRRSHIEWTYKEALQRMIVIGIGAFSGAWCIRNIPNHIMHDLFSTFLILLALGYFIHSFQLQDIQRYTSDTLSPAWAFLHKHLLLFLPIISCVVSILGIGGAVFLFPLLLRLGYTKKQAATNATLASFMVASFACAAAWVHPPHVSHNPYFFGDILWPFIIPVVALSSLFIRIGIRLNHKHPQCTLYRILSGVLLVIGALHMIPTL
jgi:uncharacterized membrane protein YfcA